MKLIDITGTQIGNWLVVSRSFDVDGKPGWLCRCKCGTERVVNGKNLRRGASKSCGCVKSDRLTTHSLHKHSLYPIWQAMIQRCTNQNTKNFHRYGGRGISVDPRWLGVDGFPHFLEDMGARPAGYTIERIDNDGNYTPNNCKWAARSEQYSNRSTNRLVEFRGELLTETQWAERIGVHPGTIHLRLKKWPIERALTEPPSERHRKHSLTP